MIQSIIKSSMILILMWTCASASATGDMDSTATDTAQVSEIYQPKTDDPFNFLSTAFRTFISFVLIIFLIILTLFLFKKFLYHGKNYQHGDNLVQVLGRVPLTQQSYLYYIKTVDQILVLGLTDQQISLLTIIKDRESIEKLESRGMVSREYPASFKQYVEKFFKRQDKDS